MAWARGQERRNKGRCVAIRDSCSSWTVWPTPAMLTNSYEQLQHYWCGSLRGLPRSRPSFSGRPSREESSGRPEAPGPATTDDRSLDNAQTKAASVTIGRAGVGAQIGVCQCQCRRASTTSTRRCQRLSDCLLPFALYNDICCLHFAASRWPDSGRATIGCAVRSSDAFGRSPLWLLASFPGPGSSVPNSHLSPVALVLPGVYGIGTSTYGSW
ncbi:hypothetical protein C8Q79DRAFT_674266 [Trametes meyenii]|nr:hypothetical protein C8Q79DRAFT_674266 [Trametes meyenii]